MLPRNILNPYNLSFSLFNRVSGPSISTSRRTIANMPKADTPPGFKPLKDTALFTPFKLGPLNLEHRIVQAPLTRMRAVKESDAVFVPKDLHVKYYEQRASKGGLQLTEATDISKYVCLTRQVFSLGELC
jgi:hypothetical protein